MISDSRKMSVCNLPRLVVSVGTRAHLCIPPAESGTGSPPHLSTASRGSSTWAWTLFISVYENKDITHYST